MPYLQLRRPDLGPALILSFTLALSPTLVGAAQEEVATGPPTADAVERLTEAEYLEPLFGDPRLRSILLEGVGVARANLLGARALADPEVAVEREMLDDSADETTLTIGWRPPLPGRRSATLDAAEAELAAAEAGASADLAELVAEWRAAFAEWAAADARVAVLRAHHDRLRELARRTAARAQAGEASGLDSRRLTLAAARVTAALAEAEAELLTARAVARSWRPDLAEDSTPLLPTPRPPGQPDARVGEPALLIAAEAEARSAELSRQVAEHGFRGPTLLAGWKLVEAGGAVPSDDGPVIGLAWSLPSPTRRQATRAEATVREVAARSRADLLRLRLGAELEMARVAWAGLTQAAAEAQEGLAAVEPATAATEAAFAAGELDLTSLLDVLASAREARLDALDLQVRAIAAERRYLRLNGAPMHRQSSEFLQPDDMTQGDRP